MNDKNESRDRLTRDQVSERLGVSLSTVDRWKRRGVIQVSMKKGKRLYFDPNSLLKVQSFLDLREWINGGPSR